MKATLIRIEQSEQGALGILVFDGKIFCFFLQPDENDPQRFHLPAGDYIARRFHGTKWPNTFEIVRPGTNGVDGHTDLLFHAGNTETDSRGCTLLGATVGKLKGDRAVLNSGMTFQAFLNYTKEVNDFDVRIVDYYY
jgi:hypothetical protein